MEFFDENIVELRRKLKSAHNDIYGDFYVDGEKIEFEEVLLFNNKLSIMLPKNFVDMPLKIAQIKYPSAQRPQIIKTNLLGSINFTFSLFDTKVPSEQMEATANEMKALLKRINPALIFYENGNESIGSASLSWFDYKGYGIDSQIYYINYLTSIDNKLLMGAFNCMIPDKEAWGEAAHQVICSIRDLTMSETC